MGAAQALTHPDVLCFLLQDRDSTEEDAAKPLMPPEMSPELAVAVAEENEVREELGPGAAEQLEELGEPQEEGGMEPEAEQVSSELEEEELGTEEQEEDQEPCEEPNDLGDPAVMRAVQSKPTLEVTRERRGRGPTLGRQAEGLAGTHCSPFHPHACGSCPTEGTGSSLVPAQGRMTCRARVEYVPVTSSLLAEPGLGGTGQQDWCLLGRVRQRGHGKNVPSHPVMRLSGPCSVPCPCPPVLLPRADHLPAFQLAMDPAVWGSCPGSILPHHVLEVGTPSQALGEQLRAPRYPGPRVMQAIWGDRGTSKASSRVWRCMDVSLGCQGCGRRCPP